jgi:hypothetical protein
MVQRTRAKRCAPQYKKARKANESAFQLPQDKAEFFKTLLETQVRQMQWGEDMPWGLGGDDSEIDADELDTFMEKRKVSIEKFSIALVC